MIGRRRVRDGEITRVEVDLHVVADTSVVLGFGLVSGLPTIRIRVFLYSIELIEVEIHTAVVVGRKLTRPRLCRSVAEVEVDAAVVGRHCPFEIHFRRSVAELEVDATVIS